MLAEADGGWSPITYGGPQFLHPWCKGLHLFGSVYYIMQAIHLGSWELLVWYRHGNRVIATGLKTHIRKYLTHTWHSVGENVKAADTTAVEVNMKGLWVVFKM